MNNLLWIGPFFRYANELNLGHKSKRQLPVVDLNFKLGVTFLPCFFLLVLKHFISSFFKY
jgi:hypothetical protein